MTEFRRDWTAEVLAEAPLIAPARQYVWPRAIAGEEDAMARGALKVMVRPAAGGSYLLTCALGFRDPGMPSGVWGCPSAGEICVLAGGYGYLARVSEPEGVTLLAMKPVVEVVSAVEDGLLLFVGFQNVIGWGANGLLWESKRLSWEGVKVSSQKNSELVGTGWDLMADKEVEFRLDLRTGVHVGGGFRG